MLARLSSGLGGANDHSTSLVGPASLSAANCAAADADAQWSPHGRVGDPLAIASAAVRCTFNFEGGLSPPDNDYRLSRLEEYFDAWHRVC
jgi:hypothetical protein